MQNGAAHEDKQERELFVNLPAAAGEPAMISIKD